MGQNFTITIILILIYVAWHVISALAQARAKKLEQEKMREMAERRRREAGHFNPASYPTGPGPQAGIPGPVAAPLPGQQGVSPSSGPIRTGVPIEDLAARRKAQLEQLRHRRESRRGGQPIEPSRAESSQTRTVPPYHRQEDVLQIPDARRIADQEAAKRAREEERKVRELRERATQQRQLEIKARRERVKRAQDAASSTVESLGQLPVIPANRMPQQSTAAGSHLLPAKRLADRLQNRATLRELFVVKELLDRPLSLRD